MGGGQLGLMEIGANPNCQALRAVSQGDDGTGVRPTVTIRDVCYARIYLNR